MYYKNYNTTNYKESRFTVKTKVKTKLWKQLNNLGSNFMNLSWVAELRFKVEDSLGFELAVEVVQRPLHLLNSVSGRSVSVVFILNYCHLNYWLLNYWSFELLHVVPCVIVQTTNNSNAHIMCAFELIFCLFETLTFYVALQSF